MTCIEGIRILTYVNKTLKIDLNGRFVKNLWNKLTNSK